METPIPEIQTFNNQYPMTNCQSQLDIGHSALDIGYLFYDVTHR